MHEHGPDSKTPAGFSPSPPLGFFTGITMLAAFQKASTVRGDARVRLRGPEPNKEGGRWTQRHAGWPPA